MTEQLNVQQMAQRLLAADNILILCHKNPDGDTIGCGSALYYALKALEKTTAVLCSDAIPSRYAFTNPRLFKGEFEPRTVIAVDVAGLQLFGENNGVPQFARHVDLCIDHHAGNNGYADFTLLDAGAAAAAELLYQVIVEMGVTITPHIADCLYTGVATDTGCFKFSSTTANTHTVAAKLIEAGCHVEELNTLLFDTKPRARMVVDAEIDVAAELRHPVVLAEELEACHVHGHDDLGFELALVQTRVGKRIPAGNGVGAEHRRCFVQRTERVVQGAAAANGIPIRVFVAQNQNVVRSQELFGHLLHIQLFCHPMIHPFRRLFIPRSATAVRCRR